MVGLFVNTAKIRKAVEEDRMPARAIVPGNYPSGEQQSSLQQDINLILKSDLKGGKLEMQAPRSNAGVAPAQSDAGRGATTDPQALLASLMSNPGLLALFNNPNQSPQSFM